jgi:hypothetical protein
MSLYINPLLCNTIVPLYHCALRSLASKEKVILMGCDSSVNKVIVHGMEGTTGYLFLIRLLVVSLFTGMPRTVLGSTMPHL